MKIKTIITIILLVFVSASIAYLVVNEINSASVSEKNKPSATEPDKTTEESTSDDLTNQSQPAIERPEEEPNNPPADQTTTKALVYYFHGYARCIRCKMFEAYTQEAIPELFAEQLKDGQLQLKIINVEEPANNHFINDYKLVTKSIVISRLKNGKEAEWKNLVRIWELVGNKEVFKRYIQDEIAIYLGAN